MNAPNPVVAGLPSGEIPKWAQAILDRLEKLTAPSRDDDRLTSNEVMKRFRIKDRTAFWQYVRKAGVPHIKLNSRHIVFPRAELEAWESNRTVGAKAKK